MIFQVEFDLESVTKSRISTLGCRIFPGGLGECGIGLPAGRIGHRLDMIAIFGHSAVSTSLRTPLAANFSRRNVEESAAGYRRILSSGPLLMYIEDHNFLVLQDSGSCVYYIRIVRLN
jgi:hypothetical protein